MYAALRCRAVGTCFSQHATVQNRSFILPVLHEATVQRTAEVPTGMSLRHVAQTKLAIPGWYHEHARHTTDNNFDHSSRICSRRS